MGDIELVVRYMEMIAADNAHGYAQDRRNGNPDYDCSSLAGTALKYGGFKVNPLSTTRNLYDQLIACGFVEIPINAPRQRGDIFLTPGKHVVVCTDAKNIVHASYGESGITNQIPGDQTGREICVRSFYTPSYSWKHHMRYNASIQQNYNDLYANVNPVLKKGSKGVYVLAWQKYLNTLGYNLVEDSDFGSKTEAAVKDYQRQKFPNEPKEWDGIIGAKTWATIK